jgi:Domain of unknown function (DUF1934).
MNKIKLTSHLCVNGVKETNINNEHTGILKKNTLIYNEDNMEVEIKILKDKVLMCRKTDEYEIVLNFNLGEKTTGKYDIYKIGKIDLEIETSKLNIEDGLLELSYKLDINNNYDKYNFILNYEVI